MLPHLSFWFSDDYKVIKEETVNCPVKKGSLLGLPCHGNPCCETNGCPTVDFASCNENCLQTPSCKTWSFDALKKHCWLTRGKRLMFSRLKGSNNVWGLPCRMKGKFEMKKMRTEAKFVIFAECQDPASIGSVKASEFYRGRTSTTRSGKRCQDWETIRSQKDVGNHNYCRNPNSQWEGVGCYTADGGSELCNVPICGSDSLTFINI